MKTYSAIIRKGWIYYPMLWVTTLVFAVLCGQWLHTKDHATYAVPAVLLYAVIWVAIGKRRGFKKQGASVSNVMTTIDTTQGWGKKALERAVAAEIVRIKESARAKEE